MLCSRVMLAAVSIAFLMVAQAGGAGPWITV